MYQTLYRKYRPQTFSDVCGQDRITAVLRRQVEEGTCTHAYLFCGTRGTGKTTCAKILAKAVNCLSPINGEPCNECANCRAFSSGELLDVQEVDAASNTGVDNIRKLCDELNFLPSTGQKRVYIIDEVHMLSIGAFNALLKTLEEPPAHALFVLATTELHKVPATVRSRCQCFTFNRLSVEDIASRVLYVSEKESIPLERVGAELIARLSDGALRDALSLLELCVGSAEPLTEETLNQLFGLGSGEQIKDLVLSLILRDAVRSIELLNDLYASMGDLKEILLQTISALRDMLLYRVGIEFTTTSNRTQAQQQELQKAAKATSQQELLYAVNTLEDALVRFDRLSVNKKTVCEMAFMRICVPATQSDMSALFARVEALEAKLEGGAFEGSPTASKEKLRPVQKTDDNPPWLTDEDAPAVSLPESDATPAATSTTAKMSAAPKKNETNFEVRLKEKISGGDPLLGSLFAQLQVFVEGTTLELYGEVFTIMMLGSREKEILEAARSIDANITSVTLSDGKPKRVPKADLSDF